MHLAQRPANFVIPLEKKKSLGMRAPQRMGRIFYIPVSRNINPSNRNFQRSEHVEAAWREVQSVTRMFRSSNVKSLILSTVLLAVCGQAKLTVCDSSPLHADNRLQSIG